MNSRRLMVPSNRGPHTITSLNERVVRHSKIGRSTSGMGQKLHLRPGPRAGLFPLCPQKRTLRKRILVIAITARARERGYSSHRRSVPPDTGVSVRLVPPLATEPRWPGAFSLVLMPPPKQRDDWRRRLARH
jgi:hypothetical protein